MFIVIGYCHRRMTHTACDSLSGAVIVANELMKDHALKVEIPTTLE